MDIDESEGVVAAPHGSACSSQRKRVTSDGGGLKMNKKARKEGLSGGGGRSMARTHRAIITKIRMKNFLSYEDHVVDPGPRLNLILGVNGSGKSTINNAICIGLGFDAKLLDRFDGVGDFIKRGKKKGLVEVHLSQPEGKVAVIVAKLEEGKKNAQFTINGKDAKKKEVTNFARGLGINLDNLCHFLPQEKVVQFASLAGKPTEMLKEVELAVGSPQMMQDHNELIDMTANSSDKLQNFENLKVELEDLRVRAEALELELQRYERMQQVQVEIKHVEWKALIVRANAAKEEHKAKREEYAAYKQEHDALETAYTETKAQKEEAERELEEAKRTQTADERRVYTVEQEIERMKEDLMEREKDGRSAMNKIARLQDEKDKLEQEIRRKEELVTQFQAERDSVVVPRDIDDQIKAAQNELSQANRRLTELSEEEARSRMHCDQIQRDIRDVEGQIQRFQDLTDRKIRALKNSNPAMAKAYQFVTDRQNMFDAEVFGPICVHVDVEDEQNAAYVESALGWNMLNGFVVQNDHDYKLLHQMMDEPNSPVKRVTVYRSGAVQQPATSNEAWGVLRRYGIEYHLIDKVKAPGPVMSVLTGSAKLHKAYVGKADTFDRWEKVLQDPNLKSKQSSGKWLHVLEKGCFTPRGKFSATFSYHGNQNMLPSSQNSMKRAAQLVVGDPTEKEQMEARRDGLVRDLEAAQQELSLVEKRRAEINPDSTQKRNRLHQLKADKDKKKSLETKIAQTQRLIADLRKQDPLRAQPKYERDRDTAEQRLVETATAMLQNGREVAKLRIKVQALELRHQPLNEKCKELTRQHRLNAENLKTAKNKLNALALDVDRLKKDYETAKKRRQDEIPRNLDAQQEESIRELPNSEEELNQKLDELNDELDGLGVQSDRRQEYEDVKNEMVDVQQKIDADKDDIDNQKSNIQRLKDRWLDGDAEKELYPEPARGLRNVIALINDEFSQTFAQMGNVGEVKLREAKTDTGEDDFANYAIEILVKFRKTQDLQKLDGHVQSGGETSLSTMLFLVSLQQITDAPFRVVDEINQGMDHNYEKAVFDRIVQVSCLPADTSQTFLITPKLAHGLLDGVVQKLQEAGNLEGLYVHNASKGVELQNGGIW